MSRLNKKLGYPENIILEIFGEQIEITDDMKAGYFYVLQNLPLRQQQIIDARYGEKKSYQNVAKDLGLPEYAAQNNIIRAKRTLRHPSNVRYIRYGYEYLSRLNEEEETRLQKYAAAALGEDDVELCSMEEISANTYTALYAYGFRHLKTVGQYIKEYGKSWYLDIPGLTISGEQEVAQAIIRYSLDKIIDKEFKEFYEVTKDE